MPLELHSQKETNKRILIWVSKMMNSKYFFLHIALIILFLFFSPSSAHNKSQTGNTPSSSQSISSFKDCFSKVYAFGDSYTDTGNARFFGALQSFIGALMANSPYGSTFKIPGSRLCDGRLVVDFLCEALAVPYLPPYKDTSLNFSAGVNFAIAGSTALTSDFFMNHKVSHNLMWKAMPENFQTQIEWFNKFLLDKECKGKDEKACKTEMENTLFWVGEMGGNDYARTYGSSISVQWLSERSVGHVCKLMKTLLDRGAKYIVVQGLPPIGCLPLGLSSSPSSDRDHLGCVGSVNSVIMAHNELLQKKLAELRKQFSHSMILYADYYGAYQTILGNYKKYQFEEPFKACCGTGAGALNFHLHHLCGMLGSSTCENPHKCIIWDGVHFTEAMHKQLTDLFLNHGFCQPSFDQLIKHKMGI